MGCRQCILKRPNPSDRPCDGVVFARESIPCGWRGSWNRPRVYRALDVYSGMGQLAADAGGLGDFMRDYEPDREERLKLWTVVAAIHRTIRDARKAS